MATIGRQAAARTPPLQPDSSSFPAIPCFLTCHPGTDRRRRLAARIFVGIVLLLALGVDPADAEANSLSPPSAFETGNPFAAWITEASRRFEIPASWIRGVMRIESRGEVHAVSPKGAMGLMQLMRGTWADLRFRYGLGADPFDPRDNILAGAAYLRELHDRYGDAGFLAAYNAGPGRYEAYLATGQPLPDETLAYVGALAPVTPGTNIEPHLVVVPRGQSWTTASLFVLHGDCSLTATGPSFPAQHDRSPSVGRVVDLTGFAPQSTGLFFAISRPNARR